MGIWTRITALEQELTTLRTQRQEDRVLIREILAQVLSLTDKQTQLLQDWMGLVRERRDALRVDRLPISYTLTESEEYRTYMEKHHPELLESTGKVGYNSSDREVSEDA